MTENKDNEQRRQEFITAAEQLFRRNGIVNTTVNSIVKELNVAKGLFYYYFTSKEDVINAISKKYTDAFSHQLRKPLEEGSYEARLYDFFHVLIREFTMMWQNLNGHNGNLDLGILASRTVEEAKAAASDVLEKLLEEGIEQNRLNLQEGKLMAQLLTGGITEMILREQAEPEEIEEIVNDLLDRMRKE